MPAIRYSVILHEFSIFGARVVGLVDWLIDYGALGLCLETAATSGHIVHPLADMWAWIALVVMIPAGDNTWLVHQISLAVLPAETSGENRRYGRRSENSAYQYLKYLKGSSTCRKIIRRGSSNFTSHPKVCWGFLSPLKIHGLCRVWTTTLGSSGEHTNHYTTEALEWLS
jgi:hypothetical protein